MKFAMLLRKPVSMSIAASALQNGTGSINIDALRLPTEDDISFKSTSGRKGGMCPGDARYGAALGMFAPGTVYVAEAHPLGRYPSNIIMIGERIGMKYYKVIT